MLTEFEILPVLLAVPSADGAFSTLRIQLTATLLDEYGAVTSRVFRYSYSRRFENEHHVLFDPDQPSIFHNISDLMAEGSSLDGVGLVSIPFASSSGPAKASLTVTAVLAVAKDADGLTSMYEGTALAIDVEEIALVEKVLGYRCRTRLTALLDTNNDPVESFIPEGFDAQEGPSFSFIVQVQKNGSLERLVDFLKVFSPSSAEHAADIIARMSEAEIFSRLRRRYHLTSYRERCFSFLHWYRVREMLAENGAASWILSFLTSPPETSLDTNSDASSQADAGYGTSQTEIFRFCLESVRRQKSQQWGTIAKFDNSLVDTLLSLWTNREHIFISRLSCLLGPEPFLFDPKARFQQVLASEIEASLSRSLSNKAVVEYSLYAMLSSKVSVEAWEEARVLLPTRMEQCDPNGACARVYSHQARSDSVGSVDTVQHVQSSSDIPSSPAIGLMVIRPQHGAAFTRKQIRTAFAPIEQKSKRRYKSLLSDAYAVGCPYLMQIEIFLMGIAQKKGIRARSPVLWRRSVEMPDDVEDYLLASHLDSANGVKDQLTQPVSPVESTRPPSKDAPSEPPKSDVEANRQCDSVSFLEGTTNSNRNLYTFSSVSKFSEAFEEWAGACRAYSEHILRANHADRDILLHPVEVAQVTNESVDVSFRSTLVSLMKSSSEPPAVHRFLIPTGCSSMVDAISVLQHNGVEFLSSPFEAGGSWFVAFSNCRFFMKRAPGKQPEVSDWVGAGANFEGQGPFWAKTDGALLERFMLSDWHFGKFMGAGLGSQKYARVTAECDKEDDPHMVFAVCDIIVPPIVSAPVPSSRISIVVNEFSSMLNIATTSPLGGTLHDEKMGDTSFFAYHSEGGVTNVIIKALIRCEAYSRVECSQPQSEDVLEEIESRAGESENIAPALIPEDEDIVPADCVSSCSDDDSIFVVNERPLDLEKVGKVGALFRSASGAFDYLDDGRSEVEVVPERVYPTRVRASVGESAIRPDFVSVVKNEQSIRNVKGMDKFRKDSYSGSVPKRVGATSRSSSSTLTSKRRSSRASTTRNLQTQDAADAITSVNVRAILGDTGNAGQNGMPLTAQQERMVVRSVFQKRDYSGLNAQWLHESGLASQPSEMRVEHGGRQSVNSPPPNRIPSHNSQSTSMSALPREGSRANFSLKMSYDAKRTGVSKPAQKDSLFLEPHVPHSRNLTAPRGALSSAAAGIFGGIFASDQQIANRSRDHNGGFASQMDSFSNPGLQQRSGNPYYQDPQRNAQVSDEHLFIKRADTDFAVAREGSSRSRSVASTRRDHDRKISESRERDTDVDEHGVPYRMYDEISRSPSVVAASHFLHVNKKPEYAERQPKGFGASAPPTEPIETSKHLTATDLFVAAGGTTRGEVREVGKRALSTLGVARTDSNTLGRGSLMGRPVKEFPNSKAGSPAASDILEKLDSVRNPRSPPRTTMNQNPSSSNYVLTTGLQQIRQPSMRSRDQPKQSENILRSAIEEGWAAFRQHHDSDRALSLWTRAATSDPFSSEGVEAEGIIAEVFEDDLLKAEGLYRRAVRLNSENHAAMVRLAHVLETSDLRDAGNKNRIDEAVSLYRSASKLGNRKAMERLGML